MRIGIDATMIFDLQPTGFGVYSINIVNELYKIHEDIIVWTIDDSSIQVPKKRIRKVLQPYRFLKSYLYLLRPFWVEFILPWLLKREGVDVLYAPITGEMTHCPVPQVVTVHDLIPLTFPEDAPWGVQWNYTYRVPGILKNVSHIITDSEHTKNDVLTHYKIDPCKVHTVYLGYDPGHFSPRYDLDVLDKYQLRYKMYVLSVGNAQPRKNLSRLIEAFAIVKDNIPHHLIILGPKSPADLQKLTAHIAAFGISDRVTLIDYVPYEELPFIYSGAALFAYVSLYEGFGLPVLEAMACGTPVVASNTTSIPEVAGNAAVLVDPADTVAIAKAIMETITNDKRLKDLSEHGLKRCLEFSWEQAARRIFTILKSLNPTGPHA